MKYTGVKKLHGFQSVLKSFKLLITQLQIIKATEIYLIAPEKLTFECILDYFESRVIFLQSCVSFGRKEYLLRRGPTLGKDDFFSHRHQK